MLANIEACDVVTLYNDTFGQVSSASLKVHRPTRSLDFLFPVTCLTLFRTSLVAFTIKKSKVCY